MGSTQNQSFPQEEEAAACARAFQLATSSAVGMVLKAAIELDVLEIMARAGPGAELSPAEIAAHLPTGNPHAAATLDRMLRFLASYSLLTCSVVTGDGGRTVRRYGLAPVCRFLTKNGEGVSLAALVLMNHDKWILHDWSDEHCLKILKNCWEALPNNGKVIVAESLLPEAPETNAEAQAVYYGDLAMLTYNIGGRERTKSEFESLAKEAGFSRFKAECCVLNIWVMEFLK